MLELKEQVLFDSRVREQVEQLKEFLEDKMDKNECASSLEMKPDRSEMQKLLSDLKKTMSAQMKKVVAAAEDGDEVDGVGGGGGPGEAMISTSSVAPATQSTSIDNRVSRSSPSSRSRGGPTGRGPTGGSASNGSAGYGEKKHMYANLVWKKGKIPAPKPLVNANPEAIKVAYGGGYSMALGSDSQGPPLRQGHSAEVLPKLQRPPPPNPRTG